MTDPLRLEHHATFPCFGGTCGVHVGGDGPLGPAEAAVATVRTTLLAWHDRFSRFRPDSELSRLNANPARTVAVSPLLARLARATADAGRASAGLVDATLGAELVRAGYGGHRDGPGVDLAAALAAAPARRPAGPDARRRWASIAVDLEAGTVTRPPGVAIDGGGLAKGLFADVLAERLAGYERFVVNCCGDLRLGGRAAAPREVRIAGPFDGATVHAFRRVDGAVATSSLGRRSWWTADGRIAHHLLDPGSGEPAFTGVVQASALAPTALEAERRSKAALLSGPAGAAAQLPHGGLLVLDDGATHLVPPREPRAGGPTLRVRAGRLVVAAGPSAAVG